MRQDADLPRRGALLTVYPQCPGTGGTGNGYLRCELAQEMPGLA